MPFSIELLFDDVTEQAVCAAWDDLAVAARNDYMRRNGVCPHIALAVLGEGLDVAPLQSELGALASRMKPLRPRCKGIDSFQPLSDTVYLSFEQDEGLTAVHAVVAALLKRVGLVNHEYYRADRWVPHCTLAEEFSCNDGNGVLEAARQRDWNLPFKVNRLALVQYPPTRLVATWELRD